MQKNNEKMMNIEYELRTLLANLRKTVELCFFTEVQQLQQQQTNHILESENGKQFLSACLEILQHNLIINVNLKNKQQHQQQQQQQHDNQDSIDLKKDHHNYRKFIEDFEYLYETTQLTQSLSRYSFEKSRLQQFLNEATSPNVKDFLLFWLRENLKTKCLTLCLQALIADKELKDLYYEKGAAFIQSEDYATAFCICVSSLEQNQFNLLSQINTDLYQQTIVATNNNLNYLEKIDSKPKRRSGSHPNIAFGGGADGDFAQIKQDKRKRYLTVSSPSEDLMKARQKAKRHLSAIRKTKSLPNILSCSHMSSNSQDHHHHHQLNAETLSRPRCKTLGSRSFTNKLTSRPKIIPKRLIKTNIDTSLQAQSSSSNASFSTSNDDLDTRPSTSKQRTLQQHLSSTPITSYTTNTSSSLASLNLVATNAASGKHQIEIINCDNIKIWTDQSLEEAPISNNSFSNSSQIDFTPQSLNYVPKPAKSISPINNFFSNLFGTPPTYTSWSPKQYQDCNHLEALDASMAFPCNKLQTNSSPITSSVFDAFLPTVGKKLRSRKSQSLFEDGISTLDYSSPVAASSSTTELKQQSSGSSNISSQPSSTTPQQPLSSMRNTQTLTDYLKMSHLSRNNTELEKENAHFTISEAIISAIEHIKWAKSGVQATTATDWLEKDQPQCSSAKQTSRPKEEVIETNELLEHTPYAEHGCYDELSAEIIGLTIISKFTDNQLPKVSELKWLVSDEDTPQSLLPMPDNSPTSNPDENVTPSMTRGTRYWAPPRQQIIFTEHPTPNRKELLLKQNYRCAGCGMRVSLQNMGSFRYCTYLGKYHCTGCHRNQMSVIPAKILKMWDFKCYPVSVFSYRLLEQMYSFPLFYVPDLNPALYVQTKSLRNSRQKRRQLAFVKLFVGSCRFAIKEQQYFTQIPDYITSDPDLWSLSDFMDVYDKSMQRSIEDLILKCENHIHNCVLCTARGFYCEHCNKEQIIFPWENKTFRCDRCGSCYHMNCWYSMSETCNKCQRLNKRQEQDII